MLGQFKSGKSSLLNAIIGRDVLPVGVLPVTAVITRLSHGGQPHAWATRLDGSTQSVALESLVEYVSESGNPDNIKGISTVDVELPSLAALAGLRLVDTPGLESIHSHNTRSTMDWLPSIALALVAISVERPLSESDRRLIEALRPLASRVIVVLTKVDLVSEAELAQVREFVGSELRKVLGLPAGSSAMIVPFSVRAQRDRHVSALRDGVLAPIARNAAAERHAVLEHKLGHLQVAARQYLQVALKAAESTAHDRDGLLRAVLDESVKASVLARELALAGQSVIESARPAFEDALISHVDAITGRVAEALGEMRNWRGHLGTQAQRYRQFMRERMFAELTPLNSEAAAIAARLVDQAELHFRRVAEGFRDRLSRNVNRSMGIALSPVAWAPRAVHVPPPPVLVGETFMVNWDFLWWMMPMPVIGRVFRRHCRTKVPWVVLTNVRRFVSTWFETTQAAVDELREEAEAWVNTESETLTALLSKRDDGATEIRSALSELDALSDIGRSGLWGAANSHKD